MKRQILEIADDLSNDAITVEQAQDLLLRLFAVMKSDCKHEWLNHSFDHFGFLQEQICDRCGAKQSVS